MDLSCNRFGKAGTLEISEGIKSNESLAAFKFARNGIKNEGASNILQSLVQNKSITFLDLSQNKIGDEASPTLAKVLEVSRTQTFVFIFLKIQISFALR